MPQIWFSWLFLPLLLPLQQATHALLDDRRLGDNKDVILGLLKSLNVKVYKPEYIPAFLQGADDLETFSLLNSGAKRKAESTSSVETTGAPNSKRGRLSTRSWAFESQFE